MFNSFKKRRKFNAAARNAVAAFEELRNPLNEVISLIQEVSALNLPEPQQAELTRDFTDFAVEMRKCGFAVTLAETLVSFRTLRDEMVEAVKSLAN